MKGFCLGVLAACSSSNVKPAPAPLGYATSDRAIEWITLCHEPVSRILMATGGVILTCGHSIPSWSVVVDRGEIVDLSVVAASSSDLRSRFDQWGKSLVGEAVADKLRASLERGSIGPSEHIVMDVSSSGSDSIADVRWSKRVFE